MTAASDLEQTSTYALQPRAPLRAWAVTGLALLAGGLCLWSGLGADPTNVLLVVLGSLAVLAGVVMGIAALAFISTCTLRVTLSPSGFEVKGPGYHKQGSWIDVDAVSSTPDGARLVIASGQVERTFIQAPGGQVDAKMHALTEDIAARLRALEA